ncbi:hypothetical protein KI688_007086 [Linnemannia hyalina]|uniref:Uncharacterized protein n=1 Tax=Linnemannia hyalina TaxID=64524 RepID=A0A9P8BMW5_9FUNG|nr:hypothetical protein KI688_007086 [Linnemannia hyalina]
MPYPDLCSQLRDMPALQRRLSSCVKPGFDTGTGDGSSGSKDPSNSNAKSIVAPVVGGVVGFVAIALLILLIFRQRRQRRTANNGGLLGTERHLEEAPDPFKSQTKRMQVSGSGKSWCESAADASSRKDVIRIAYIPRIASEDSTQLPELAALGGGPQASFMASFNDAHSKHSSIASSLSTGTLDEAVVMAIGNKATPQLLRLHTIKSSNSDMIQRSNTLHSSNSIKRTKSQRRVAEANKSAKLQGQGNNNNNPGGEGSQPNDALEQLQAQPEPEQQYTPAVMVTGPSARSSAQSTVSNQQAPSLPSMVLEPRPLHSSYHTDQSSIPSPATPATPPPQTSGAQTTTTIQHSASAPTALASLLASTSTTFPTIPSSVSAPPSAPPSAMHAYPSLVQPSPMSPPGGGPSHLSQSPAAPTRNSTFSTLSDGRSTTTRGEGEEIMIFWDGHRGSKTSNL